jgi:hypothetical protein
LGSVPIVNVQNNRLSGRHFQLDNNTPVWLYVFLRGLALNQFFWKLNFGL